MSDVFFIVANPRRGKSAIMAAMALLLQQAEIPAAVAQCGGEDGSDALKAVCGFGEGVEGKSVVTICHAGDENEAHPMCGMSAVNGACDGVPEACGADELIKDTQLASQGGDLGVVGEHLGACGIELDHVCETDTAVLAAQASTEGAGCKAGVAA